jgi:iodotyrosine deiodinase
MEPKLIPYSKQRYSAEETKARSIEHLNFMEGRRTVREFSSEPIDFKVIENIIMAASTAPSGANKQPWTFCVVTNAALKSKIRIEAEKEEYESYTNRMSDEWLEDLSHLGTDWQKPFLEEAPALIVVFRRPYELVDGKKRQNYYVYESVGIAVGYLLEAIHYCGLVALTHTPSPMNFLNTLLQRPENEKPFLLIPIGFPKEVTMVPNIKRKTKDLVIVKYDNF